jgi:hypothetical protein
MNPYNGNLGQTVQTDGKVNIDMAFLGHIVVTAADAVATSGTGIKTATNLLATTQTITTGITDPAMPRALSVVGNVSGVTGNVLITGKNYNDEVITETIALNAATPVNGAKAFKNVTSIALPVRVHTPISQIETATVVGTIGAGGAGNATVVVTAAGMTGSPITLSVAVANNDSATLVAGKIIAALNLNAAITALFTVGGTGATVTLTTIIPVANDGTLNISTDNGTCSGLTTEATSANTLAGVPYDKVSVGFNDIMGLPYKLSHNTVLAAYLGNTKESTAPTVVVSSTVLESNTIVLNSALNGTIVDIYLIV